MILTLVNFLLLCPWRSTLSCTKGGLISSFLGRRAAFSFLNSHLQTSQAPSSSAFLPAPCLPFPLASWKDFLGSYFLAECLYLTSEIVFFYQAIKDWVGILTILQPGLSLDITWLLCAQCVNQIHWPRQPRNRGCKQMLQLLCSPSQGVTKHSWFHRKGLNSRCLTFLLPLDLKWTHRYLVIV